MIFTETLLSGAYIVDLKRIEDDRGFFSEAWKSEVALQYGIDVSFNRTNISFNRFAGTLRGLHAQKAPYEEAKLVRCMKGAIYDAIVDFRSDSPTYLQWFGVELTAENHRALYVPQGFLHGFQTLVNDTEVFYQVAGSYKPDAEIGLRFDDPALNIEWPTASERILSPKDQQWPTL